MKIIAQVSALVVLSAILWGACNKEVPGAPAPEDSLIAFFDGNSATLYVTPEQRDHVLELYGAESASNNAQQYFMEAQSPQGEALMVMFALRTASQAEILEIAEKAGQATDKPPKPESKVHANCDCSKTVTKKPTACAPKKLDDGTAYHEKTTYEGKDGEITYAQCAATKAKSDCIEWKSIIGHTRQYVHNGCEGLPFAETPIYEFVCTK